MDLKTVIDTAPTLKKPRRTFTAEFKHQLIQQCQQPDTSVAKVAMQHQINANLLHKWIRQSRSMVPSLTISSIPQTDFLPVILHPTPVKQEAPPPPVPEKKATAHIRIPLHDEQGSVRDQMIEIEWPVGSATELLLLLQGLIK
ncbi:MULTISPECIES: IS66-like element accessory protein TnpA [Acinetobacter]|uniref:IS66-like element accessory protein TnpA n=1 Tax=Acinetobacter TaxID=469 RepID=UPI00158941DD|nr:MULTISPECIES: transposase [Acinetobacter]QKW80919.1 transposase [Acinetobacter sp. FDAARGOS_724]QKW81416.1 transposase [Acinetobacter sp. FDAARGOS_724]QKW82259.1 transposase [Acinetobacter sp. FDAARGOS_724]QKW83474.1 transposase [Acinetobacter sp. FDAARGOS_724]